MAKNTTDRGALALKAGQVFSPAAPIREKDVFMGRRDQVRTAIDAINQNGQHVLIYGERGVGKTSLANVLAKYLESFDESCVVSPHINCDATDDFSSIWLKVFKQVDIWETANEFGFGGQPRDRAVSLLERLPERLTPDIVLTTTLSYFRDCPFIPIVDEFDRLTDRAVTKLFTDTIKALSDQCFRATVVLVGVANTVEELIAEHQSIERALVQVRMPRMSRDELTQIVAAGVATLGMTADKPAKGYIANLSQGLPHYTHLLGLHSVRQAIDGGATRVEVKHVDTAIRKAIEGAQQTLQRAYHKATMSVRSDSLYAQVLLACALAETDQLGYFAAADVRRPMSRLRGRRCEIAVFSRHLADFCNADRGPVLERTGVPRRHRFRFCNPLLQPFVTMSGLADGQITRADLNELGDS